MKTAKDVMTTNPVMLQTGEELQDIVRKFIEKGIRSAPVINPLGEIWGFITELSLIKAYLKNHLEQGKHEKLAHHQEFIQPATFIDEDMPIQEAMKAVLKAPTNRVLVKNDRDKVVGILTAKDILKFLMGEIGKVVDFRKEFANATHKVDQLVEELKSKEDILKSYQKIIAEMPYMVHSVNAEGRIIVANKKIHDLLGYPQDSLLGLSIEDLYSPAVINDALAGLRRVQSEGQHQLTYTTMKCKDGELLRVDVLSSSLKDEQGQFICTITVSRVVDSELLLRALNGVLSDEEKQQLAMGFKSYIRS